MPAAGLLIALEGGEGCGKSTQAQLLTEHLQQQGHKALQVREPGSTPLGNHLRTYLKSKQPLCLESEIMLFCAARAQIIRSVILPALKQNVHVIADRWAHSTVAYQGAGRRGSAELIATLNAAALQGLEPDITILLDLDPEIGLKRIGQEQLLLEQQQDQPGRADQAGERRFEDKSLSFHRRVQEAYRKMAQEKPSRWLVIPATQEPALTAAVIAGKVDLMMKSEIYTNN